jgi:tRNA-dihydrouridine synthase 1
MPNNSCRLVNTLKTAVMRSISTSGVLKVSILFDICEYLKRFYGTSFAVIDIARRGRYGAYLMEELELLGKIVRTLSTNLKVPVTCKTRIYRNDFARSIRLCETLVNAGASLLTIHGRTRDERGDKVAEADWEMIRRIKDHFRGRVPIIANGGIECFDDIQRCLDITGCDGVMSSEAILETPTLFANPASIPRLNHLDIAAEYLEFCIRYPVWPFKSIRSHVYKYLHRYFCLFIDLRESSASAQTVEELQNIVKVRRKKLPMISTV